MMAWVSPRAAALLAALAAFVLLAPPPAAAAGPGGVATVQTNDPNGTPMTVQLELMDPLHLRLSSPQRPEGYMLLLGNDSYYVVQFGNFPLVMSTRDMLSQLGQGQAPPAPQSNDDIRKLLSLQPTGEKETVAGIVGERYKLRYLDSAQDPHEEEVVAVRDPLIHEMSYSMYRMGTVMSGMAGVKTPEGAEKLAQELNAKGLGLLRMGTRMKLVSIDRRPPASTRFDLPADPMSGGLSLPAFGGEE